MESVCDKPQAARTRGPKIRVVGAIRVGNHKQVVLNVEVKPKDYCSSPPSLLKIMSAT